MSNRRDDYKLIWRFFKFLRPYLKRAIFLSSSMVFNMLLAVPMPLLTMYLIDEVLVSGNVQLLYTIGIGLIVLLVVQATVSFLSGYYQTKLQQEIFLDIKSRILSHIENLSMAFFNKYQSGYIVSRITDDVAASQTFFFNTLARIVLDVVKFGVGLFILFRLHVMLTVISLAILPFFVLSLKIFNKRLRELSEETQEKRAVTYGVLQEVITGMRLIKSFVRERMQLKRYQRSYSTMVKKSLELRRMNILASFLTTFVAAFGPIMVLIYGGAEVLNGNLTIGQLIAFNAFLGYLYGPLQSLMSMNVSIQTSLGSLRRIFDILDLPQEIEVDKKFCPTFTAGEIVFNNVSFGYKPGEYVLKNINLTIPAKSSIALVGSSGAGKTTLAELIARFYDPQKGKITIDGYDLKEVNLACAREQIAEVTQHTFLFSGTIKDNIKFGKLDATDEEIIMAAKAAYAHDFIMELPNKYKTKVGEKGGGLSGGQAQRIALARAIVQQHNILILDEATSALDVESDKYIQQALKKLMKDMTTVIIAHRLSTIKHVDQIVVMDHGQIVQIGDHKTLYAQGSGLYRKLYDIMEEETGGKALVARAY